MKDKLIYWGLEIGMGIRKQLINNTSDAIPIFKFSTGLLF